MITTILKHELRLMFRSPLAWIIAGMMQLVFAWLFLSALEQFVTAQAQLASRPEAPGVTAFIVARFVAPAAIIMLLISPLLCMRTLAEEQRSGALVLLRAAPVSMTSIVLGKFLGVFTLQWALVTLAFAMPLSLGFFTTPDIGNLFTAWLGISLFAAACTALSLYFSAITRQPLIASFSAFAALLFLWLLGTGSFSSETASAVLHGLSMPRHLNSFFRGMLDTRDLVYFALFIFLFLSLAIIKLDSLRHTEPR